MSKKTIEIKDPSTPSLIPADRDEKLKAARIGIARLIKGAREIQEISIADLAAMTGINDVNLMSLYEAGTLDIPLEDVFGVVNALNIAPEIIEELLLQNYDNYEAFQKSIYVFSTGK